jgi:hypothetical protein
VTRSQGVFLHSPGCVVSVPLACRPLAVGSKWAREDLSDQQLPTFGAALDATEALPSRGNALSSSKLKEAGHSHSSGGWNVRSYRWSQPVDATLYLRGKRWSV